VRVAFGSLGTPDVVFAVLKLEESVSRRLPLFKEGDRPMGSWEPSPWNFGKPSDMFVGIMPGPTLFRGGRAAGFCGAGAGNWLWRRVRMAMPVAGGGMDVVSEAAAPMLGLRAVDWLNRRMKELLRVGRASVVGAPVKGCMAGVVLLAGTAGKSLRVGSYERLFAKSSKLTEGRKSYVSVGSRGSLGASGCLEKLKRGFEGPGRVVASFAGVGRKERLSREGALVPLAMLHMFGSAFVRVFPISCHMPAATYRGLEKSCGRSLGPSGTLARPRSAELLAAGGGRDADMALEALVLRRRLLFSVVFWNLRTRSSVAATAVSVIMNALLAPDSGAIIVPDDPLDSSPETFDAERAGSSIVSIVRVPAPVPVPVRTGTDMVALCTALAQRQ
jgi:hypothetical protein